MAELEDERLEREMVIYEAWLAKRDLELNNELDEQVLQNPAST